MKSPLEIKTYRYLNVLILSAILLALITTQVSGGVQVLPVFLFLNSPTRSTTLTVVNPTDTRQEAWIEFVFGYPAVNDTGSFYIYYDSVGTNEQSAVPWMRAYPQRIVLGPKESQVVRIMVNPPVGLRSGEYWARVIISSATREERRLQPNTPQRRMALNLVTRLDIPFQYRVGSVSTGLSIKGIDALRNEKGLSLGIDITLRGNASYWGTMTLRLKNQAGKVIGTMEKTVAVFKDLIYPVSMPVEGVTAGTYTIDINIVSKRRGIRTEYIVKSDPVNFSQSITVP